MKKKVTKAPEELVPYLQDMLFELSAQKFSASQISDNKRNSIDGKNVWASATRNPKWYSELVRRYPKQRDRRNWSKEWRRVGEADSVIKRGKIIVIIEKLMNGGIASKYADDIIEVARKKQSNGEKPELFSEYYFRTQHMIILPRHVAERIDIVDMRAWEEIAGHKKNLGVFPDWIEGVQEVPF